MKKINKKFVIVGIIVVLVIGFIGYSFINNNEQDDQTVIKENVISLTDEKQKAYQLLNVFNNQLIFQDNPHYEKGDVLVSGITDLTPNGFIRKVVQVKKEKNQYVVETTNGLLTDVFETANISKKLYLTEDGVVDDNKNENVVYKQHPSIQYLKNEKKDKVESNFKYETDEKVELEGKIAFKPWIDLSIKITHGNIQFNIIGHSKFEGSLSAIYNGSAEAEYEKELFNKKLPNFQFFVANIPIVVTNNLSSNLESTANLEGDTSLSFKVDSQRAVGYQYNSKNSKIKKINTKKYNGDGLKWQAKSKLDGHGEIYIDLHILSKLYDCTGADLSIGIAGDADGLVKVDNGDYLGKLDLSVFPRVKGKEVYKLKDIMRYCKTKIIAMPIPSSDDVAQIKAEKVMQGIGEIIENEDLKEMIEIIEKQVNDSDYTAMDIAAAFLKQALGQVNLENDRENGEIDWDNTGAEEGMVRLFINIGKKDRVKPGDILGAIAGESGMPGKLVGAIDMYDKYTFVEVPREYGKEVLEAMKNVKIKGRSVNMEPANQK